MPDLSQDIAAQAVEPAAASVDGQSATSRPVGDLIAADIALANRAAVRKRRRGLVYSKLLPSGALADNGRAGAGGFNRVV